MANERLRAALREREISLARLAAECKVAKKTAERWVTLGRPPHPSHRSKAAELLGLDETYLWPHVLSDEEVAGASLSEIITVHPQRAVVPGNAWGDLFAEAERDIGILVYAGLFLAEDGDVRRTLAEKAAAGVRVRILLGDPDSEEVVRYGAGEGVDGAIEAEIRSALAMFRPLHGVDGIELRLHGTILYNSICRADDDLLVHVGANGIPAERTAVLRLRKMPRGEFANTFLESFERVWERATPIR